MAVENLSLKKGVTLPNLSRYRNSRIYEDSTLGKTYFGVWRPPKILEIKPVSIHVVTPEEINRPDLIAHRVYGNSSLFWVLAIRNNLLLPFRDITAGQSLVCPHLDDVMKAVSSSFSSNPGTV
jgi:hypothetical protein